MKAELDACGKLKISPETELESFALKMWWVDYMKSIQDTKDGVSNFRFAVLHVDTSGVTS